jgi:signal transduction histidine kinase
MDGPSTLAITRVTGLAVWAVIALPAVVPVVAGSAPASPWRAAATWSLLAFPPAFWWNARRIQAAPPPAASVALLSLQATIALAASPDLVILVALEIPFVLAGRAAVAAAAGVVLACAARSAAWPGGYVEPLVQLAPLGERVAFAATVVSSAVWQGLGFAGGYVVATQHRSAEDLAGSHRELARVNAELMATQQLLAESSRLAERMHISRELHDTVGHHLAVLSLDLELAARRCDGPGAEPVREAQAVAKLLLADVRDMVSTLRHHGPLDLGRALRTVAAGTAEPRVHLAVPDDLEVGDPAQAHAVFRCVQEAITNAVRHASARNLWVEVARAGGRLEVRVRDDGRGACAATPGNGLTGMRERFEDAGGGLTIASSPGQGFEVRAWLPAGGEHA